MPRGSAALRSLLGSQAPAAPATGLGGVPGKSCRKGRDFPRAHLAVVPKGPARVWGAAAWGNGLGAPRGLGCCRLGVLHAQGMLRARGCSGARWVQHDGGSCLPTGRARWWVAVAAGGRGDRAGDTVWLRKGQEVDLRCRGWKGEQDGGEPCPGPACNVGLGQEPWGGCRGRGARPKGARGMARREEGWRRDQRCAWHSRGRTKAPMQEGAGGAGRGRAVPPITASLGPWPRGGCQVPLCWVASGRARRASRGEFLTVGVGGIVCALKL